VRRAGMAQSTGSMTDRINELEIKLAYLEQANAELSGELFQQRRDLEALREQLATLIGRFEAAQSQPTAYTPEDEKPPHY
jgi:SlyX protein